MSDRTTAGVTEFLRDRVSERTKVPVEEIGAATNLVDIGLESVDAVLICGEIEDMYQIEVEPSLMFEFQTLGEVVNAVMPSIDAA
ncbi:MAG: acyl carrier protein [Burkholderiales bacterium]|nr:MAG: acyl carrier protein [Burkholderiales bacterium]